jgi:hypothetical protein
MKRRRKAMDKLNGYDSRQAMWDIIRKIRTFTVRELHQETTLEISTVRDYVKGLCKAGYLAIEATKKASGTPGSVSAKAAVFSLEKDVGVDAPRVRKDGTKVTQGQGRINMWRTMRVVGDFTAQELAIKASTPDCIIKVATAVDYAAHLCYAGYLRKRKNRYLFLQANYTGPKPPMIQRVKRVWDQNLKKVMWREDALQKSGGAK